MVELPGSNPGSPWFFCSKGSENEPDMDGETKTGLTGPQSVAIKVSRKSARSPLYLGVSPNP